MSEGTSESDSHTADQDGPLSVPDAGLPEDLRPTEDNPLALPAADDVPDDLLMETHQDGADHGSGGGSEDASKGGDDALHASSGQASSEAAADQD